MDQFGQNAFAPGMKSALFVPDQLVAGTLQLVTDTGIITGGAFKRGTVLGLVAASGKYTQCVKTAEDGSQLSESETLAATAKAAAMNYADIVALQGKTNDATTTNKGIIRVSDSRTSTESGVAASSLAASQNYSDMKGLFGQCGMKSRNLGVVYTNSQSFAIFVSVNAVLSDGSSFLSANVSVDGNSANFRGSQTTNLAGQRATIAFMVPAGATYVVQQFSGTVSDVTWGEVDKK
ncbi:head decoration protein [Escherichia coli]|uniref:head decoration protein n=2 Tax=Enterobacteriaceae TaxID=543 RepID=UPI001F0F1297|nr:head decoration protein [Escherichia coli]UMW01828.1 head decoration protein [Escherichia coli]